MSGIFYWTSITPIDGPGGAWQVGTLILKCERPRPTWVTNTECGPAIECRDLLWPRARKTCISGGVHRHRHRLCIHTPIACRNGQREVHHLHAAHRHREVEGGVRRIRAAQVGRTGPTEAERRGTGPASGKAQRLASTDRGGCGSGRRVALSVHQSTSRLHKHSTAEYEQPKGQRGRFKRTKVPASCAGRTAPTAWIPTGSL